MVGGMARSAPGDRMGEFDVTAAAAAEREKGT